MNYLQRMSGIATYTNEIVKMLEGSHTTLLDTRKTTPNMRIFEKYAVKAGGATNHRYNLSDAVMLKDNHIGAAGSITKAVKMARDYVSFVNKVEVEVENLDMVREAVEAGADIIMLDNMSHDEMKEAIKIIDGRALTECSGNVTKENIPNIVDLGVDYVSSGALTHSCSYYGYFIEKPACSRRVMSVDRSAKTVENKIDKIKRLLSVWKIPLSKIQRIYRTGSSLLPVRKDIRRKWHSENTKLIKSIWQSWHLWEL